ncbi:MAG: ATP-binding cassette domain-containing protein [Candidatus Microbacterium phytovorans]|uniref:ATP-binding cassette domain-containing protein n=1 Tax=Candidatus Microbacterium phytovorans TaxID=3121374 RepID=A0AAJ5VZ92_9MICO|nr:ATP-binding cassette domain-containing protein [Microbacterium sp.]WEK12999.1 MAG: ATP-binding cassette domain-containing protein [Microbacterium sp.]
MDELTVTIENYSLRHGRRTIISDLNLTLTRGITALLGPNGAGKSTLLNGMAQPHRVRDGSLALSGRSVTASRVDQRWFHSRLGFMPQQWRHFPSFTVEESVAYVGWLKLVHRTALRDRVTRSLARVDLLGQRSELVARLSGGTRQRVGLAEALVNDPDLVLLDEPTVGLDPAQRAAFRRALASMRRDRALLLSTHLTDDVAAIADRVLVLAEGAIVFDGSPASLADASGKEGDFRARLEEGYLRVLAARAERLS